MVCLEGGVAAMISVTFRPEASSLMRGVSVSHLLAAAGKVFRVRADELPASDQARLHDRSVPVRAYHRFLSHCWSSPGWQKVYVLASDHLGPIAFLAASVVAVAVHVVQHFYELPTVPCTGDFHGNPFVISFWELCLGEAAALCVAFAGHNFCTTQYFLDCVCIHQTDLALKKAGVAYIPEFIRSSGELFVLWDETYLTRLWCVYELAVAHSASARTTIRIMPLRMSVTLVKLHVFVFASELSHRLLYVFVPHTLLREVLLLLMRGCCFALVAHASADMARMLQSLEDDFGSFRVRSTQISDEADRRVLYVSIEKMYGSLDAFDIEIRTRVRQTVMESLVGQRALLPYRALLVPMVAEVPSIMSCCTDVIGQSAEVRTVLFMSNVAKSFAFLPVCIALAMSLGSAAARCMGVGKWALFLAIGVVVSAVRTIAVYFASRIPRAIARGNSQLGLELEPWHAVLFTLVAALPMCVAAVWLFRPTHAAPSGTAAARERQGACEVTGVPLSEIHSL